MAFVNLYALLGVEPTATDTEIVNAMCQMAQLELISMDDLKLCKITLLDPDERKKYNARLFVKYPEILEKLTKAKEGETKSNPENKNFKIMDIFCHLHINWFGSSIRYSLYILQANI